MNQPEFEHRRLEAVAADLVIDAVRLSQQLPNLAALVGGEVAANSAAEVGRLADVEDVATAVPEQIDARLAGKTIGETQFGSLWVARHGRQGQEVVEADDAHGPGTLDQNVEEIAGGECVIQGPVAWSVAEPEPISERAEFAIGDFVAQEPPCEWERVDRPVGEASSAVAFERGVGEREVVADVVAHEHGVVAADEIEERGQDRFDAWRSIDHLLGDAGEHRDLRWNRSTGIHEGLVGAETVATAQLHGADLGDATVGRLAAGGLDVEHDERDLVQGRAEIVEGSLTRFGGRSFRGGLRRREQVFGHRSATVPERAFGVKFSTGVSHPLRRVPFMSSTTPVHRRHLHLVPDLPETESMSFASLEPALTIDCDACEMQHTTECDDCLVSYLVGHEEGVPVMLDQHEKHAVDLLADAGLVPPSRFQERTGIA